MARRRAAQKGAGSKSAKVERAYAKAERAAAKAERGAKPPKPPRRKDPEKAERAVAEAERAKERVEAERSG